MRSISPASPQAAAAFQAWVARIVEAHRPLIESAIARVGRGDTPRARGDAARPLHARRLARAGRRASRGRTSRSTATACGSGRSREHLSGRALPASCARHRRARRALPRRRRGGSKSFSCWEEFDGGEHASTLGAVVRRSRRRRAAARRRRVGRRGRPRSAPSFSIASSPTDASRAGLPTTAARRQPALARCPVRRRAASTTRSSQATVEAIRRELRRPGGGVYRYLRRHLLRRRRVDSPHVLARAGTTRARQPRRGRAAPRLGTRAGASRTATCRSRSPSTHRSRRWSRPWVERWGPVATPLLWSHAMYLIMEAGRVA